MSRSTVYIVIISLLLICNGIFAYLFFARPDHPPHHPPKDIIIEKLGFSKDQVAAYEGLIKDHRAKIVEKEQALKIAKNNLYALLLEDDVETEVDKLANQIGQIHVEIEHVNFNHFCDLRDICTPEQEIAFNKLVKELSKLFAPHHPPKKKK
ncbi:Spy/CpxP family protein refolding chaperone [Parvicella tangerina]|uniref:Periplasmic heavy metal sensor n=1 Tax=Parvicella tangerina TaxID=2829795 RepID=A0A916JKG0_9FLAO|nr:hypothetical protein [Parvicella tangerina]CAG5079292.1 hypothetical protein CRYO30217_00908 [Parvicella tangerina]